MEENNEQFLKKLTVDTLRVYNYLLKNNPKELTLEQLSSALDVSKPTILHHMEKLKSLDIVEQTMKGYKVKEIVKITVIKGYKQQFRKLFLTWVPLTFIFFIFSIVSAVTITQIELKATVLFLCIFGILIAVKEIKQLL
jgi:biotin operon repressor